LNAIVPTATMLPYWLDSAHSNCIAADTTVEPDMVMWSICV